MIDIHSHILPAVDDGSTSWEMTAEMCSMAIADGVTHIVATPHCNDEFRYERERYAEMMGELYELAGGKLTFSLGCDFHFSYDNVQEALAEPQRFTIEGTNYLLIELSDYGIPPAVMQHLEEFSVIGVTAILTHPERNMVLMQRPEMILDFLKLGCLVQITANSLTGFWGSRSQKIAENLLRKGAVHVIASDAHNTKRRTPLVSQAYRETTRLVGRDVADALLISNPAAIVAGQPLPHPAALH
jgi:protein-tyrosine phosphatase